MENENTSAKELVDQGAAELCRNEDLTGAFVAERLDYFLQHDEIINEMKSKALTLGRPQAAQDLLNHCLQSLGS